jgi:hypothetical protein
MPEPIIERLSKFTPDGAGLDRDALFFNAGRASVRPRRVWMVTAGALAACQVLTLALMWPRSAPRGPQELEFSSPQIVNPTSPAPDSSELRTLNALLASKNDDLPSTLPCNNLVPGEPPLTANSAPALAGLD